MEIVPTAGGGSRFSRTPVAKARNLGPVTGRELNSVGIYSLEQLRQLGWEEACLRWIRLFPGRLNRNAFSALLGALEDVDWRSLSPTQQLEVERLVHKLRGH